MLLLIIFLLSLLESSVRTPKWEDLLEEAFQLLGTRGLQLSTSHEMLHWFTCSLLFFNFILSVFSLFCFVLLGFSAIPCLFHTLVI